MGVIRTLLALAVVVFHSYSICGHKLTGGTVSVQSFYLISGFYMAMILNEKYRPGKGSYKLFISNRFLRLYPAYWVCLAIAVLVCVAGQVFFHRPFYLWYWTSQWAQMNWTTIVFFIFANLFLFGSDWLMFSGLSPATGRLTPTSAPFLYSYRYHTPLAGRFLFIPQIWSVGVEISFYLLAPFVLRTRWMWQVVIVCLSLGLRYWLYHSKGLDGDPWNYRFFPNEIAFFITGSLAYRVYDFLRHKKIPVWINAVLWSVMILSIVFYPDKGTPHEVAIRWSYYCFFAMALPFVFMFSRNNRLDRFIGELSYPVYICHHFIMSLWREYIFNITHFRYLHWFGVLCVVSSLAFAVLLWYFVMKPVEKLRQQRILSNAAMV